jgi:hypothetical protein
MLQEWFAYGWHGLTWSRDHPFGNNIPQVPFCVSTPRHREWRNAWDAHDPVTVLYRFKLRSYSGRRAIWSAHQDVDGASSSECKYGLLEARLLGLELAG